MIQCINRSPAQSHHHHQRSLLHWRLFSSSEPALHLAEALAGSVSVAVAVVAVAADAAAAVVVVAVVLVAVVVVVVVPVVSRLLRRHYCCRRCSPAPCLYIARYLQIGSYVLEKQLEKEKQRRFNPSVKNSIISQVVCLAGRAFSLMTS